MKYDYLFHERAQKEYEDSFKWYAERSADAAQNFSMAVDSVLQLICDHPFRWRNTHRNYHELGLKKFPFTVIYTVEANHKLVVISSVYHHKRNPKKRHSKIKQS